jgi:hypothetical protein
MHSAVHPVALHEDGSLSICVSNGNACRAKWEQRRHCYASREGFCIQLGILCVERRRSRPVFAKTHSYLDISPAIRPVPTWENAPRFFSTLHHFPVARAPIYSHRRIKSRELTSMGITLHLLEILSTLYLLATVAALGFAALRAFMLRPRTTFPPAHRSSRRRIA